MTQDEEKFKYLYKRLKSFTYENPRTIREVFNYFNTYKTQVTIEELRNFLKWVEAKEEIVSKVGERNVMYISLLDEKHTFSRLNIIKKELLREELTLHEHSRHIGYERRTMRGYCDILIQLGIIRKDELTKKLKWDSEREEFYRNFKTRCIKKGAKLNVETSTTID